MRRTAWRVIGMLALGIGGLVVALALTLGALALASDDLAGEPPTGGVRLSRTASPSAGDEPTRSPSPSRSHTPSPSASDASDDPSGSDDRGGGDSSGPGSGGSDSSGPGSGSDDHSHDDD